MTIMYYSNSPQDSLKMMTINGFAILAPIILTTCLITIMKCSQKDNLPNLLKYFVLASMAVLALVSVFILNLTQIFTRLIFSPLSKENTSYLVGILASLLLVWLCSYLHVANY